MDSLEDLDSGSNVIDRIASSLGLGIDRAARMVWTVSGFAVLALVALILRPLALQPTGLVEKAFNVGYPLLDAFLVVLANGLFLQTRRLRGGGVCRTWRLFIVGILIGAAGDFCFASEAKALVGVSDDVAELPPSTTYCSKTGLSGWVSSPSSMALLALE